LQQGYIYRQTGQAEAALNSLRAALELEPGNVEAMRALADICQENGKDEQAAAMLELLLDQPSLNNDPDLWLRLARLLASRPEQVDKSLKAYEQYSRLGEMSAALWMEIARVEEGAGMNSMAAKERALKLEPEQREIILEVARGWKAQSQPALAVWVLESGLARLPQDEELWRELISLYWEGNNIAPLIGAYREYIKIRPDQAVLHYELGLALGKNGQIADAAASLAKACQLEPDNYDYLLELLTLETGLRHYGRALELARILLTLKPRNLILWENLSAQLGKERPAELSALLERDLAGNERPLPKYHEILALLALNRQQPGEAAGIMEKALALYPANLRIMFLLGNICEGLGEEQKALGFYEKIMEKDPGYHDVNERYLEIKIRLLGD
jgi:tetratricopeptide (TPR) repeat protein